MSTGLELDWFYLQRYKLLAHKLLDSNVFSLFTGHAHMPKEFLLCEVSKIKEGLGKTPYFISVLNDPLFKLCVDLSWNFVGMIPFCP